MEILCSEAVLLVGPQNVDTSPFFRPVDLIFQLMIYYWVRMILHERAQKKEDLFSPVKINKRLTLKLNLVYDFKSSSLSANKKCILINN